MLYLAIINLVFSFLFGIIGAIGWAFSTNRGEKSGLDRITLFIMLIPIGTSVLLSLAVIYASM